MKYIVLLYDGVSDLPVPELGGKTPLQVAHKPVLDSLVKKSKIGLVKTVADRLKPGSDVANLSVLGYDPEIYYTGRSPLEAASIGAPMTASDVSLRCNLVTLKGDAGAGFEALTMADYCAGDIDTEEAAQLIAAVQERFGNERFTFYTGTSYRHCLIWHGGTTKLGALTPPHDISDRVIAPYILGNNNPDAQDLLQMMRDSYELLSKHPVNLRRAERGLSPANSIWLWGEGRSAALPSFSERYGVHGVMVSAVDLLKGIGKLANMRVADVPGATAWLDTNFEGKANAALSALDSGCGFAYVHIEAPDECGHRHDVAGKVKAIELIDERVLKLILDKLNGEPFRLLICPDHPTPLTLRTHTNDPVPFLLYDSEETADSAADIFTTFTEETAKNSGLFIPKGHDLIKLLLNQKD